VIAFDTNVFVYSTDKSAGDKHARSVDLLAAAMSGRRLFVPAQVLAEYYAVATRKVGHGPTTARGHVETWAQAAGGVVPYEMTDLRAAMDVADKHNIAAWDALIWAVCERHGVDTLVTEDFQNGRKLGRVTFLDTFDPANGSRLGLGG